METIILWVGGMTVLGWLAFYFFGRQFVYDFVTAYPLIKKMKAEKEDLIDSNANKYTTTSAVATAFFSLLVFAIVIVLFRKKIYCIIAFAAGFVICGLMLTGKYGPDIRKNFDAFCGAYYRFVPDDELRTAMYNQKPSQMKTRLHDMGLSTMWIPDFKKESK